MIKISDYLQDIKLLDGIKGNLAILRMMKRYACVEQHGDYENSNYVEQSNQVLGWDIYARDVITPFWKTFSAALVYTATQYELVRGNWETNDVKETYVFIENNIYYRTYYDKNNQDNGTPLSRKKLGTKYIEKNDTHKGFVDKTIELFPELEELAKISDSFSNFSPCPEHPFNLLKGLLSDTCDFLNLFVDKIQDCVGKRVGLEKGNYSADADKLKSWYEWLKTNRELFFLQDYYEINGDQLKGKPLFPGQSLSKPLPITKEEIRLCVNNELEILKKRAKMIKKYCVERGGFYE